MSKSEPHLMIDFETLDVGNMPALLSIGAVVFDPADQEKEFINFYKDIDIQTCIDIGGTVSGSTFKWWMNQNNDARMKIAKASNTGTVKDVFTDLAKFCKEHKIKKVWGHGATFDPVIAENYFNKLGIKVPWIYYNVRDTRTLFDLTGITRTKVDVKHNALEDARGQAIDVKRCIIGFKNLMDKVEEINKQIRKEGKE